jgi:NAD(P)-dependent dehydrogenase (short-subunit alcohol dehydrogenase family)
LAREGAIVCIADANRTAGETAARAIVEQGAHAEYEHVDVTDSDSVRTLVERVVARHGRLDVLYHSAIDTRFVNEQDGRLTELPDATWSRMLDLVLGGTIRCCKYAGLQMIRQGSGSIILTATVDAQVGVAGLDSYTAAKGGVIALTRSLAAGLAPDGVRVNTICPGFVASEAQRLWLDRPGARAAIEQLHLLPIAEPADIAPMVLYLASDESRVVTGSIFSVDGGYTAFKSKLDVSGLVAARA